MPQQTKVSVLITDLDNTLFDWFSQWYQSFNAMLLELEKTSGVARDILVSEIKRIHEQHGTSEYAFVIEEIPSLRAKFPGEDLVKRFDSSIHAYRSARKKHLHLYPTVLATLQSLKLRGVTLVAYTESMGFYSNQRIKRLGLDGVLDALYSPPDHDLPQNLTPEQVRRYPPESYSLKFTRHAHTPRGELKPNPKILLSILDNFEAGTQQCAYVGDDLVKDISMARDAGILDAYAEYGSSHQREEYELLKQVTHWTSAAVEKQQQTTKSDVKPSITLRKNFSELLTAVEFVQ